MSPEIIISLFSAILKVLPDAVSLIESLVGNGNAISPEHVPQILSTMADLSKISAGMPNSGLNSASVNDSVQSVGDAPLHQ